MSLVLIKIVFFVLVAVFGVKLSDVQEEVKKLDVTVYYGANCIDSRVFFIRQLNPSMNAKDRLKYTDLTLVPYGKAFHYFNEATNSTEVVCQQGPRECLRNALHACIIEKMNARDALELISCLSRSNVVELNACAQELQLNVETVQECQNFRSVVDILIPYSTKTEKIALASVPSIQINNVFNYASQRELLNRFDQAFCKKYKEVYNITLENCSSSGYRRRHY